MYDKYYRLSNQTSIYSKIRISFMEKSQVCGRFILKLRICIDY